MTNKIINYSIFAFGILAFAFAVIFVKDVVILDDTRWNITTNIGAEEINVNNGIEVDKVIDIYNENSSVKTLIQQLYNDPFNQRVSDELSEIFRVDTEGNNWHGIINEDTDSLIYATGTGCQIMEASQKTTYGIKWAFEADSGEARFVIKDIDKNIVYEIDENTKSFQEEFILPAGTYFIYDEVIDGINLDYYYYFAKK